MLDNRRIHGSFRYTTRFNKGITVKQPSLSGWSTYQLSHICTSVLVWNKTTYEISSDLLTSILLWLTILETMEYLSFCVWIVLFTRVFSRFMNTSTNSRIFFLQWLNKPHCLCIYAYMSYFLYPFFINRWSFKLFLHLGCSEKCWKRTWKYRYR